MSEVAEASEPHSLDEATCARRDALSLLEAMSQRELRELAVRAGIYTEQGRLAAEYDVSNTPARRGAPATRVEAAQPLGEGTLYFGLVAVPVAAFGAPHAWPTTAIIEIEAFVAPDRDVPGGGVPNWLLVPRPGAERAYRVIAEAMMVEERAAVVRCSFAEDSCPAFLHARGGHLFVSGLSAVELLGWSTVALPSLPAVRPRELDLARAIVRSVPRARLTPAGASRTQPEEVRGPAERRSASDDGEDPDLTSALDASVRRAAG